MRIFGPKRDSTFEVLWVLAISTLIAGPLWAQEKLTDLQPAQAAMLGKDYGSAIEALDAYLTADPERPDEAHYLRPSPRFTRPITVAPSARRTQCSRLRRRLRGIGKPGS
jgi:hypothetical protein